MSAGGSGTSLRAVPAQREAGPSPRRTMSGSRSATSHRAPWEGPSLLSSLVCERREPLNPGIWLKAPHFPTVGGSQRELEHSPSQSIVKTQIPLILTWSGGPAPPAGSQRCPAGSWELRCCMFFSGTVGPSLEQRLLAHRGKDGAGKRGNTWVKCFCILPLWKPGIRRLRNVT